MIAASSIRLLRRAAAVAALTVALGLTASCTTSPSGTTAAGPTAKGSVNAARSALSTTAPDAKLLVVQTVQPVTPTSTPVWGYLFGSQKTDIVYAVYVEKGKATPPQQFGTAGLSAAEWKTIPGLDAWKVDSSEAYKKAFAAGGGKGAPAAYTMGFVTFIPKSAAATSAVQPMRWIVRFDPGTSGVTTRTIEVDARTGSTSVKK